MAMSRLLFMFLITCGSNPSLTPSAFKLVRPATPGGRTNFHNSILPQILISHGNDIVLYSKISSSNDNDEMNMTDKRDKNWLLGLCLPLWVAYVSNQWSRSSIYYLVDFSDRGAPFKAMNVDLHFSQAQYGILASIAFTSLFALASLIAGVASDRYNRKVLTVASAGAWAIATLGTSLSTSYEGVLVWRILMGLACAFSTPTAYTLLAERVPTSKAALSSSLYSTGIAVGGALASLSIILDTEIGWRDTAFTISLFAFGSALFNLLVLEDDPKDLVLDVVKDESSKARITNTEKSFPVRNEVFEILSPTPIQLLYLASFLRFCSGLLIGVWSAPYFRLIFPDNASEYAVAQAAITASCGIISSLIGGYIADRIKDNGESVSVGRQLWVPVAGNFLAIPCWYMAITSVDSFQMAMVWLAIQYLVAECWFGPTISVLQASVRQKTGGTAQGLFTVTGALGNLAPAALGFFYEQYTNVGPEELTTLLVITVCSCYALSAILFGASAVSSNDKTERAKIS
eukprot:CAMPEP_0178901982 /NCGR_PEP_ID=MMETSP0786-20121207/4347_1 /TAXON_ID=186022 /ORGANISM="Thalassionema frauenfeldii, Strain CCMP 1798" /LENGTH=515 /DNA_ID=CAMNT_0020573189 /DNA_START=11 /DNA_END=1558 /DNA_ORIENTATION=-